MIRVLLGRPYFTGATRRVLFSALLLAFFGQPLVAEAHARHYHRAFGHHQTLRHRAHAEHHARMRSFGGGSQGLASYYGGPGRTASGGHVGAATCAHRSLPFGTLVRVVNLANSRSMLLTVNDRGPFAPGRIVDVSKAAAARLDMLHSGVVRVALQVVGRRG